MKFPALRHPHPVKAYDPAESVDFYGEGGVLQAEVAAINERRAGIHGVFYEALPDSPIPVAPNLQPAVKYKAGQCTASHRLRPFGLALSGGGIRSATFNLGVLQGLAERGLLPYLDYLSTVSGGGYIGAWFHGLIRHFGGQPARAQRFLSPVDRPVPGLPEKDAISFLRKFSNYLAPNPGLFSADTWVIGSIWLRNVLLNQLILLPTIAALVLVALFAGFVQQLPLQDSWKSWNSVLLGGLVLLMAVMYVEDALRAVVARSFSRNSDRKPDDDPDDCSAVQAGPAASVPYLAFIACLIISCLGTAATRGSGIALGLVLWQLFAVFQEFGGFRVCFSAQHQELPRRDLYAFLNVLWMSLLSAGTAWILIWLVWKWSATVNAWVNLAFAPPLACIALMCGVTVLIGLMGADYPDGAREWLSNVGSNLSMICAAWSAFFALTIFGPWAVSYLLIHYSRTATTALTTWGLTTLAGVIAGSSSSTDGVAQKGNSVVNALIVVAPTLFVLGYLLLISFGTHALIRNLPGWDAAHAKGGTMAAGAFQVKVSADGKSSGMEVKTTPTSPNWPESHLQDLADWNTYFDSLKRNTRQNDLNRPAVLFLLFLLAMAIGLIASLRININEFSIHHFYKNRLVRCYMGASHGDRRTPDPRTGFDPQDDFPIRDLQPEKNYFGPYAIVNTALNLNAGSELATQERKASSFIFTPKFSGYEPAQSGEDRRKLRFNSSKDFQLEGFRVTEGYSSVSGPGIGTTMAISGAAANPNWGYHTSGPMAFLLTVFNVRLGWWLGNPRFKQSSPTSGPRLSLKYLLLELIAQTTARTRYVNLSDGGHFENLGLYELVRRRCRYIIVGDAEQDGGFSFESLGGAIRKCRADFGVEITINPDPIRLGSNNFSTAHCVVGSIIYPEPERGFSANLAGTGPAASTPRQAQGWLLYLKASVTGNEPADIIQYRSAHKEFPHEPTSNQFYTESQFESYRRLGLHVVREAFADVDSDLDPARIQHGLLAMFQELTRKWYAPVAVTVEAGAALNNQYLALMRRLSEDHELLAEFAGLLPDTPQRPVRAGLLSEKSFIFGTEVVQLMEEVVNTFDFEQSANFFNPGLAGWVQVFTRWAQCDTFYRKVWERCQGDYQLGFQKFVNKLRNPSSAPPPPSL